MSSEPVVRAGRDPARDAATQTDDLPDVMADPFDLEDGADPYGEPPEFEGGPDGDDESVPSLDDDPYVSIGGDFGDSEPVLLVWPQPDFEQVDQRWPEVLEPIGTESWDEYRRHYQGLIVRWTRRGLPLSMVTGTAEGFAEWLVEQGADPVSVDLVAMADRYGDHLATNAGVVELPPAPQAPCWCGSGVSYQQCCEPLARA